MRTIAALAVTLALLSTTAATTATQPIRLDAKTAPTAHQVARHNAQLVRAAKQVGQLRQVAWRCQDDLRALGLPVHRTHASTSIWAMPRSVSYRLWVAHKWIRISKGCQHQLQARTIPFTNDWVTAVHIAQRYYPGTERQLLGISHDEGGSGPWKWYNGACSQSPCLWRGYHVGGDNVTGADTVGGWLQFRYSTFAPWWRHTVADLTARGYLIPVMPMPPAGGDPKYAAWLNPLGQALTAAYMHHSGNQGCHWCG